MTRRAALFKKMALKQKLHLTKQLRALSLVQDELSKNQAMNIVSMPEYASNLAVGSIFLLARSRLFVAVPFSFLGERCGDWIFIIPLYLFVTA